MPGRLMDRDLARARMRRRGYPIHAYIGPNGTGKTMVMCYDTITSLQWGRTVLSTVRLLDYLNPRPCPGGRYCDDPVNHERERIAVDLRPIDLDDPDAGYIRTEVRTGIWDVHPAAHPLYVKFVDYQQLLDLRNADCLMDEVTGIASSRDSMSGMPTQVANMLVQLRRRNVVLRWSAPAWGRADKIIREVSQAATLTVGYLGVKAPPREGEPPRLWKERRLFVARTYDAALLDEFDARRAANLKPLCQAVYWGPGAQAFAVYDTYEPVTSLGWAQESGLCAHCGGKRTALPCGCPDYVEQKKSGRVVTAPAPVVLRTPALGRTSAVCSCGKSLQDSDECRASGLCLLCLNGPVPGGMVAGL